MESTSSTSTPGVVKLDSRQLRALAHPLRARLLAALRAGGPATATVLAELLGTNTGATSYHLRQLAEVGLVSEEPGRGTGRQRFWQAAHKISTWQPTDFEDDPDARAASDWIQAFHVRQIAEYADRWIAAQYDWPRPWREAATSSDALLTLSPQRLRALNDEMWQVAMKYRDESIPDEPDAEQVLVLLAAFPFVEGVR